MTGWFGDQTAGQGGASAKLKEPGDTVAGTIVSTGFTGVSDFTTGQPVINPATGQQEQQLVITVELINGPDNYATASKPRTDETGQIVADDGHRSFYVRKGTNISFAIARALQAHNLDDVEIGGKIWVRHTKMGTSKSGTQFKEHEAGYQPAPQKSGFEGFGQAQQAQAPAVVAAPPVAAPPAPQYVQQPAPVQAPAPVQSAPLPTPTDPPF